MSLCRSPAHTSAPARASRHSWLRTSLAALLSLLTACTGAIDAGPSAPGSDDDTSAPAGGGAPVPGSTGATADKPSDLVPGNQAAALACKEAPIDPGPSPLRLLSREQYLNTLSDLFGDAEKVAGALPKDGAPTTFGLLQGDVSQVELEQFQKTAENVAAALVADKAQLAKLAPCSTPDDVRSCARAFVQQFGAKAYRAPVTDATDIERHLALYDVGKTTSHEHGLELLLRGMLQSPRFLYRVELGTSEVTSASAVRLSDYELAARLSYLFWKTLPDDTLRAAAAAGKLHTPEQLTAQVDRMLEDPKGKPALRQFLESLMQLDQLELAVKDGTLYPAWKNTALQTSMRAQASRFFDSVLADGDGTLRALLTSQTVFYDEQLASYYGQSGGGSTLVSLERTDGSGAGLLTLPAWLSIQAKPDESSPINRGKFVREVLLCQQLPAPPANIPKAPEVKPDVSTRARLSQHEADPSCSGCHRLLDPIGFGLEHFDAIGRYRKDDGGKPVDASGELVGTRDVDGKFVGARELGERLAASEQVEECMTRQWFRFALGRFEQKVDDCTIERLHQTFVAADASLHALPHASVVSDAFSNRRPIVKESP